MEGEKPKASDRQKTKLLRIRIGEYQSKSRTKVRGLHGAEEKGNAGVKGPWANLAFTLPACMHYPHCC